VKEEKKVKEPEPPAQPSTRGRGRPPASKTPEKGPATADHGTRRRGEAKEIEKEIEEKKVEKAEEHKAGQYKKRSLKDRIQE